jgi:hypothetical protein
VVRGFGALKQVARVQILFLTRVRKKFGWEEIMYCVPNIFFDSLIEIYYYKKKVRGRLLRKNFFKNTNVFASR